jgi:CRISPR-associated protein Cmr4
MKQKLLYIFTRTPLHVGAGSSIGAVDQPVQRERHTGFPIIPGSSVKGVLRDHLCALGQDVVNDLFGKGDEGEDFTAGKISFGEARLVAFPVRSAKGAFALATSLLTLQRLARDSGITTPLPPSPAEMTCLAGEKVVIEKKGVVLEEYRYNFAGPFPVGWEEVLTNLLGDAVLSGAKGRFVLLSDGDLSHFAMNACQVNQHVRIDDETGTAQKGGLFNEETVPSECLFYAPLTVLHDSAADNGIFKSLEVNSLCNSAAMVRPVWGFAQSNLPIKEIHHAKSRTGSRPQCTLSWPRLRRRRW